ncbi:MAG: hypothetical protein SGI86_17475 [Deltaproteobacteria bacterium]|nr:hypothetical protein [Deltaproteobacteria bacterium]
MKTLFERPPFALCLAAFCVAISTGCGGTGELSIDQTGAVVEVRNGAGISRPERVVIELYQNGDPTPTSGVTRAVETTSGSELGEMIVFTSAETTLLRVVVWGQIGEDTVSRGEAMVAIRSRQQVRILVTLSLLSEGVDAGPIVTFDDGGVTMLPDASTGGTGGTDKDAGAGGSGGSNMDAPVEPMPDASPPDVAVPKAGLGETCLIPNDCGSGFCVDRVCCNTSCTGTCVSCKAPLKTQGMCEPLAQDLRCASPACVGQKTLRTHACDGFGVCVQKDTSCNMRMCSVANPNSPTCE